MRAVGAFLRAHGGPDLGGLEAHEAADGRDGFGAGEVVLEVLDGPEGSVHGERANFGGLVLGCIESYDSESKRIFSDFSRSTRFSPLRTALNPKFQQKLAKISSYFYRIFTKFC